MRADGTQDWVVVLDSVETCMTRMLAALSASDLAILAVGFASYAMTLVGVAADDTVQTPVYSYAVNDPLVLHGMELLRSVLFLNHERTDAAAPFPARSVPRPVGQNAQQARLWNQTGTPVVHPSYAAAQLSCHAKRSSTLSCKPITRWRSITTHLLNLWCGAAQGSQFEVSRASDAR